MLARRKSSYSPMGTKAQELPNSCSSSELFDYTESSQLVPVRRLKVKWSRLRNRAVCILSQSDGRPTRRRTETSSGT